MEKCQICQRVKFSRLEIEGFKDLKMKTFHMFTLKIS